MNLILKLKFQIQIFLKCDDNEKKFLDNYDLGYDLNINYQNGIFKKNRIVKGSIFPFIYKNNEYQKLVFCELNIKFEDSLCMPKSIENLEKSSFSFWTLVQNWSK